jgi:c-di-GMP-related signal transduction protein
MLKTIVMNKELKRTVYEVISKAVFRLNAVEIDEVLSALQQAKEKGATLVDIDFRSVQIDDIPTYTSDVRNCTMSFWFERPETEEEYQKRVAFEMEAQQSRQNEEKERRYQEYLRLKKEFGD